MSNPSTEPVRLDRWLWAARLAKTRGDAAEAIRGGRVSVDGSRAKPSKTVGPGAMVQVTQAAGLRMTVTVTATGVRRGSAVVAATLYVETPESVAAREALAEERRLTRAALGGGAAAGEAPGAAGRGRPTKRDRRRMDAARGRGGGG